MQTCDLRSHEAEVVVTSLRLFLATELILGYAWPYRETLPSPPPPQFLPVVSDGQLFQWNESMKM